MAEFEVKNLGVDLTLSESEIEILIDLISQVLELFGDFIFFNVTSMILLLYFIEKLLPYSFLNFLRFCCNLPFL